MEPQSPKNQYMESHNNRLNQLEEDVRTLRQELLNLRDNYSRALDALFQQTGCIAPESPPQTGAIRAIPTPRTLR